MADPPTSHSRTPQPVPDLTGMTVGRFTIRARLGAGGMGEVYLAEDTKLKRSVALKRMAPKLRADERYRHRFIKEAERASSLNDHRIAGIYDVLEEHDETFLVMEYVEGVTLRRRLQEPFALKEFLPVAIECAEALVAAHEKGLIHRDIKPENIMLTLKGGIKILDFGVARRLPRSDQATDSAATDPGEVSGTLAYMAPEVLLEKESDQRSDLFSLGVVFYEALAGRHPFLADSFIGTSDRILHAEAAPLRQLKPELPEALEQIVARLLAKDPAGRYARAADLVADLRALAGERQPPTPSPHRWIRRWSAAKTLSLLAALAVVAVLATLQGIHRPPVLPERATILVADFENRTSEKLFDQTLSPLLSQSLLQSRYVSVVPRLRVLEAAKRAGRQEPATVDAGLGREICLREGYRALLTGRIIPSGSEYQLSVQVVNPEQGLPVITETEAIHSPADLYAGVDRLAGRLRHRLGESLGQIEKGTKPLARVTTPSLEALQRYSRALDLFGARDFEGAVTLAQSAVEKDPNFAMAHVLLANTYEMLGNRKATLEHRAEARKALDHVTEREQRFILALSYDAQGLYAQAVEQYRLLLELDPNDLEALRGVAESAFWMGRTNEAIQAWQRAHQLNPSSPFESLKLMHVLIRVSRCGEALTVYNEARARKVSHPHLHYVAGLAQWCQGDTETAGREFEVLRRAGGAYEENLAQLYQSRLMTYQGRMREAEEALQAGLILDQKQHSETWIPLRLYLLARVALVRGRLAEARAAARQLGKAALAEPLEENLQRAGWLALQLGDSNSARSFLETLKSHSSSPGMNYAECYYFNLKGDLELAAGNPAAAIESQHRALVFFPTYEPYASLAHVYWTQKKWQEAIQAYEQFLAFKGGIFVDDFAADWVLAHLQLARAFVQAGDPQQALRSYDEFLRLWAGADTDLPALRQARAERQKLLSQRSQASRPAK